MRSFSGLRIILTYFERRDSMLDITLLGTGGMMPLPDRYLTSLMIKYNGYGILFDCGEGTQMALHKAGLSPKQVDVIFLTHLHADHTAGLPGLLLKLVNAGRTERVHIIGPEGTAQLVEAVKRIALGITFELEVTELYESTHRFELSALCAGRLLEGLMITAFETEHSTICYGYTAELARKGKFSAERAEALGIEKKYWRQLQSGENVTVDGVGFTPDMVMGAARKGLKLTYCTDTIPTAALREQARGSDLLILEGMYGEHEKQEDADSKKHLMMQQAAEIAAETCAGELWLTHFSPSEKTPEQYAEEICGIFPNTVIRQDGVVKTLRFED